MRSRVKSRVGLIGAVLALLIPLALPAMADVDAVDGFAYGENVDITLPVGSVSSGPTPFVELPADGSGGGPFTDSLASVSVTDPGGLYLATGVLDVSTEGGNLGSHAGFATSSSTVNDIIAIEAIIFPETVFTAESVATECTSNGDGSTASTTIVNGQVFVPGTGFVSVDASPAPNTTIVVSPTVSVTLNRQVTTDVVGVETAVEVAAIVLEADLDPVLGSGVIVIAESFCSAQGPNVLKSPPIAVDDTASTDEDTATTIDVLANDSDPDGDALTITDTTDPANGSVVINGDGTVTYTPDANFVGDDTFDYTACDIDDMCDTATVTVSVAAVNDAPVAVDDDATTDEDTPTTVDVLDNDTDADGDPLTVTDVSDPANGSVVINGDGTVTYTPDDGFVGDDSFTYTVCDPDDACDTATVTVSVAAPNSAPVAVDDTATTDEDSDTTVDVLDNDSDADGDPLTVTDVSDPANGSVVINGDGTVTYTPDDGFVGDDSFTYTVCDPDDACDTATVTVSVAAPNSAPVAVDDTATTDEDSDTTVDVLDNDSDADGDPLTVTDVSDPANGSVVINGDGTVTYTPDDGFVGDDSFTYTVCDPDDACDTATVTVSVSGANSAPVAEDDTASTNEDSDTTVDVLDNDSDADGDPLTVTDVSDPANGSVVINGDGTVTYTPDDGFSGNDSFTYTVCDSAGACDTATVNVTVLEGPTPINPTTPPASQLPFTGAGVGMPALVAVLILMSGMGLLVVSRRRGRHLRS